MKYIFNTSMGVIKTSTITRYNTNGNSQSAITTNFSELYKYPLPNTTRYATRSSGVYTKLFGFTRGNDNFEYQYMLYDPYENGSSLCGVAIRLLKNGTNVINLVTQASGSYSGDCATPYPTHFFICNPTSMNFYNTNVNLTIYPYDTSSINSYGNNYSTNGKGAFNIGFCNNNVTLSNIYMNEYKPSSNNIRILMYTHYINNTTGLTNISEYDTLLEYICGYNYIPNPISTTLRTSLGTLQTSEISRYYNGTSETIIDFNSLHGYELPTNVGRSRSSTTSLNRQTIFSFVRDTDFYEIQLLWYKNTSQNIDELILFLRKNFTTDIAIGTYNNNNGTSFPTACARTLSSVPLCIAICNPISIPNTTNTDATIYNFNTNSVSMNGTDYTTNGKGAFSIILYVKDSLHVGENTIDSTSLPVNIYTCVASDSNYNTLCNGLDDSGTLLDWFFQDAEITTHKLLTSNGMIETSVYDYCKSYLLARMVKFKELHPYTIPNMDILPYGTTLTFDNGTTLFSFVRQDMIYYIKLYKLYSSNATFTTTVIYRLKCFWGENDGQGGINLRESSPLVYTAPYSNTNVNITSDTTISPTNNPFTHFCITSPISSISTDTSGSVSAYNAFHSLALLPYNTKIVPIYGSHIYNTNYSDNHVNWSWGGFNITLLRGITEANVDYNTNTDASLGACMFNIVPLYDYTLGSWYDGTIYRALPSVLNNGGSFFDWFIWHQIPDTLTEESEYEDWADWIFSVQQIPIGGTWDDGYGYDIQSIGNPYSPSTLSEDEPYTWFDYIFGTTDYPQGLTPNSPPEKWIRWFFNLPYVPPVGDMNYTSIDKFIRWSYSFPYRLQARVEIYDFDYNFIDVIDGYLISLPTFSYDANSDLRRSCSLSFVLNQDNASYMSIKEGSYLWLDKYVKVYLGRELCCNTDQIWTLLNPYSSEEYDDESDHRVYTFKYGANEYNSYEDNIIWTNMGTYVVNNPNFTYNTNTNTINIQGIDIMSRFTGMRNGNLEGIVYTIPKGTVIREAIIDTVELIGARGCLVDEITYYDNGVLTNKTPYDISVDAGATVFDILAQLRDILPNNQMYFDRDGYFRFSKIPYSENTTKNYDSEYSSIDETYIKATIQDVSTSRYIPTKDGIQSTDSRDYENEIYNLPTYTEVIDNAVLNYQKDIDYSSMKNVIEVYGKTHDLSVYGYGRCLSLTDNNGHYVISLSSVIEQSNRSNFVKANDINNDNGLYDGFMFGFTTYIHYYFPQQWDKSSYSAWIIWNDSQGLQQSTYVPLVDSSGNYIQFENNKTYVFKYDLASGNGILLSSGLQPHAIVKDTNPNSPFYIGKIGEIRQVLNGGEYDNINSDELALERAKYEFYRYNKLQDSITLTTMPIYELDVNDVIFIDEESLNVEYRDFDKIGLNPRDDGYLENEVTTYGMYVIKGIETNENQTLKLQKVCEWRFNHDDLYNLKTLGIPSEDCKLPQNNS